jgi:hypothetical protein
MSTASALSLLWGDEEHVFDLGIDQWRRIDQRCGIGPGEVYQRLYLVAMALEKGLSLGQAAAAGMIGHWRIDDMREVILQGLIGGGRTELEAADLVRRRVDAGRDFRRNLALAYAIVKHGLADFEDAPPGESTGEAMEPTTSPSAGSDGDGSISTP